MWLPLLYALLLAFLFYRWRHALPGLPRWAAVGVLAIKVSASLAYTYLRRYMGGTDDIQVHYEGGLLIYESLGDDPFIYLRLLLGPSGTAVDPATWVYAFNLNYWYSSGSFFMVRLHGVWCLLSGGNFWVHVVLMGGLTTLGTILAYRLCLPYLERVVADSTHGRTAVIPSLTPLERLTHYWRYGLLLLVLGAPSVVLFSSIIHKDGILLLLVVGLLLLGRDWRSLWHEWVLALAGFYLLYLLRMYPVVLLPGWVYWVFYPKQRQRGWHLLVLYAVGALSVFAADVYLLDDRIFRALLAKQAGFVAMEGNTSFEPVALGSHAWGLLLASPEALYRALTEPSLASAQSAIQLAGGVELAGLYLLIAASVAWMAYRRRLWQPLPILFVLMACYALADLLMIGWLVNNGGAIIRYRCTSLLLLGLTWGYWCMTPRRSQDGCADATRSCL